MRTNETDTVERLPEPGVRGSNQSGMRDRNERLVLTILRREGALPKSTIARLTGLSAQTVSVIMRSLERDGLLRYHRVAGRATRFGLFVGMPHSTAVI